MSRTEPCYGNDPQSLNSESSIWTIRSKGPKVLKITSGLPRGLWIRKPVVYLDPRELIPFENKSVILRMKLLISRRGSECYTVHKIVMNGHKRFHKSMNRSAHFPIKFFLMSLRF